MLRQTLISLVLLLSLISGPMASVKTITIDGSTTVGPIAKAMAEYFMKKNKKTRISISESGSSNGAKSLVEGTCDIANMSRFMKSKEFKIAIKKDITPVPHVVAMDGLAMVLHPSNKCTNRDFSTKEIKDIYAGRIKNWKHFNCENIPIAAIGRDSTSGTFETFHKLVMNKEKTDGKVEVVASNGAIKSRVQSTKGAIGYIGIGFLDRSIKDITINGIRPTTRTIAKGIYPIARPLFMWTNGFPKLGSNVHKFITLPLTRKGSKIIKKIGFVPLTEYRK